MKYIDVMTLNREICISGVKQIDLWVDRGTAEIEALEVKEDLF